MHRSGIATGIPILVLAVAALAAPVCADGSAVQARRLMIHCQSALQAGLTFRMEPGETALQACVRTVQQPKAVNEEPGRKPPVTRIGKTPGDSAATILPLLAPAGGLSDKTNPIPKAEKRESASAGDNGTSPAQNYYLQSKDRDAEGGVRPIFLNR